MSGIGWLPGEPNAGHYALARLGLPIVVVNRGLTRGDELATVRLNGLNAGTSPALEYLEQQLPNRAGEPG